MIGLIVALSALAASLAMLAPRIRVAIGPDRTDAVGTLICGVALIGLVWAPWLTGRAGGERRTYSGWSIPVLGVVAVTMCLAIAGLALAALISSRQPGRWLAASFLVVTVGALVAVLLVESVGVLLPLDFLPDSVRRNLIEASAREGLWLGLLFGIGGLAWCNAPLRQQIASRLSYLGRAEFDRPAAVLTGLLGLSMVGVGMTRYAPWVRALAGDRRIVVEGWAVPFVGPLSLAGLLMMLLAFVFIVLRRSGLAVVVGSSGAAMVALPAAIFGVLSDELLDSGLLERAAKRLDVTGEVLSAQSGSAPHLQYLTSIVAGGLLLLLAVRLTRVRHS